MGSTIFTVGVIRFEDPVSKKKTVTLDVCRSEDGTVWIRLNKFGLDITMRVTPDVARRVARVIDAASTGAPDEPTFETIPELELRF